MDADAVTRLLTFVLFCAPLAAQTFYGGGISAYPQSSPKPSGWAVTATRINDKNDVWSFSETDFLVVNNRIQTSARSGLATSIKKIGSVTVYGLADAGIATNGVATSGAYAGGGIAVIPLKRNWVALVGARIIKSATAGTQAIAEIGLGRK